MQYRYYLNGQLLKGEPAGWQNKISTIKRDYSIKGIIRLQEGSLVFHGAGYNYLWDLFNSSSFCEQVEFISEKSNDFGNNWYPDVKGLIFMSQVEFDEKRKLAKCKIRDDSFYAKIFNNKSLECILHAGRSKNGIYIDVPEPWKAVLFDPGSAFGDYSAGSGNTWSYRIFDVFKYLIAFMTDGEVEFASTYFDTGGPKEKTLLTIGRSIRESPDTPAVTQFYEWWKPLSFQKVLQELDRKENLFFIVERSTSGKPLFRLEEYDYFFKVDSLMHSCVDLDELKTTTDIERIYSKLKIGSSTILDDPLNPDAFPELIQFLGVNLEQYPMTGKCNLDKEFDLSTEFVISTNVIAYLLLHRVTGGDSINLDDRYDNDFVLIECDGVFTSNQGYARQSNWFFAGPPFYYNEHYINSEVAKRFLGAVPNTIAAYLGNGNDDFLSSEPLTSLTTTPFSTFVKVTYSNDSTFPNNDPNGNYNTGTSEYILPAPGLYVFRVTGIIRLFAAVTNFQTFSLWISRYDSLGTLINRFLLTALNKFQSGASDYPFDFTSKVIGNATDKIIIESFFAPTNTTVFNSANIFAGRTFACGNSATGGGVYQEYNPEDYSILKHEFKDELTEEEFDAIDADPRGLIEFSRHDQQPRKGWIEQLKFYHSKAQADFLLDSSKTLNK